MLTLLSVTLGLLSITAHELGHYEAMRRCGIKVKEVALLGIPLPFLPSFYHKRGNTLWGVHPFVIGAYVMPESESDISSKSLKDQLYIYASGPIVNIVYSLVLFGAAICMLGVQNGFRMKILLGVMAFCGSAWLIWSTRRFVALVLPALMVPILLFIVYSVFSVDPITAVEEGSGGPIAVVNFLLGPESASEALLRAAAFSLNLAAINLLPCVPLDGGRMASVILKTWFGRKFESVLDYVSIPLFLALVIYSFGLDALRVWNGIW